MTDDDAIPAALEEFADLLEAKGVEYKPRSYRTAAEHVRDYPESVADLAKEGREAVEDVESVGESIAGKIVEFVETGHIEELVALREELPVEIEALTRVEGVGPKTVGKLYETLGIQTLDDMQKAAEAGDIQEVSGFGAKTEQNILDGIDFARVAHERTLLAKARPRGEAIRDYLAGQNTVEECELAGSLRRWRPTVGDVDVLAAGEEPQSVVEVFTEWGDADDVIEAGTSKASLRSAGQRIDLRVVVPDEYGSALQYFTGSKDHNVALRNRAIDRELKMNEYGVFDISEAGEDDQRTGERIAGETEQSMYAALDLPWIPPELREERGEIEAAVEGNLPHLLAVGEVRGDLHVHTAYSDGAETIPEIVEGAEAFGHDYICITDHATGPGMVGRVGLTDDRLREQRSEIRSVADDADIEVFAGVEANIGTDGEISVDDDLLANLDIVVASPHAGLDGDGTERLVAAARHPHVDILGHPTGRRLNEREGMEVDVARLAGVAADHDTALEINADPRRLDLSGRAVQTAIEAGATIVINTDAHRTASFDHLRYGVHTARRGWASGDDVLNTRDPAAIRSFVGD